MIFAIVTNGVVTDRILAEAWPDGVAIPEGAPVDIGWLYDGATFSAPAAPAPAYKRENLTANDFLDLFTPAEQATFEVALESVRALIAGGATPNAVQAGLLVVNRRVSSVDLLSLDDPRIASALDVLAAAGVIQPARKAVILSGEAP